MIAMILDAATPGVSAAFAVGGDVVRSRCGGNSLAAGRWTSRLGTPFTVTARAVTDAQYLV